MYLDVYEPIWFKRGMVIDTVELYIFILVFFVFFCAPSCISGVPHFFCEIFVYVIVF